MQYPTHKSREEEKKKGAMRIIETPEEMQRTALALKMKGKRIAFAPTMGALHEGHLRLFREARGLKGIDTVVSSIFVNPAQFAPHEDFDKYPRTFEDDCAGAEQAGVDIMFAPVRDTIYPPGYQTAVDVGEMCDALEGVYRPQFFGGVATVVLKLFNIVQPDAALFGWKDAQQFLVLRRMVTDLNLPIEMIGVETVREEDGLALSSRNRYLSPEERAQAPAIWRGLNALSRAAHYGERYSTTLLGLARYEIEREPLFKIQYLEMVSMDRLQPLKKLEPGNTLVAVAAFMGTTRLIDNVRL